MGYRRHCTCPTFNGLTSPTRGKSAWPAFDQQTGDHTCLGAIRFDDLGRRYNLVLETSYFLLVLAAQRLPGGARRFYFDTLYLVLSGRQGREEVGQEERKQRRTGAGRKVEDEGIERDRKVSALILVMGVIPAPHPQRLLVRSCLDLQMYVYVGASGRAASIASS